MKKFFKIFLLTITLYSLSYSQPITVDPVTPTQYDSIVVFLNTTLPGASELLNYTGIIYAHTGVTIDSAGLGLKFKTWQHVIGSWGQTNQPALTRLDANLYKLTIGFPRTFYSLTNPLDKITQLDFVFRSADGSKQTRPDIFLDLYEPGLTLVVQNPSVNVSFSDPLRSPAFVKFGETVNINVNAVTLGTSISSLKIFVDGSEVSQSITNNITYDFVHSNYVVGSHSVSVIGTPTSGEADTTSFIMFCNPEINYSSLPNGIIPGINYTSTTNATLALFAPYKSFVYLLGDFNDWKVNTNYFMNCDSVSNDSVVWWQEVTLSPAVEYAFQYLVDGTIRVADPYSEKILDPWNDQYIPNSNYPDLITYPNGKTEGIVGIVQTNQNEYQWQINNFNRPAREKLIIYELLVRDFSTQQNFQFLIDTLSYLKSLGVNAIELMPIMEFSGNNSWGYNPIFHTAVDKYYGTDNKLKEFIDLCHQNGIAVILDMVLNQADNLSPLAKIWWDDANNSTALNSPYLNQTARHPFSVFNDFNHESNATKYFVDRVNEYWLTKFKFDGFRFDLSKGFTQKYTTDVGAWGAYDESRINILKRMADKIWEIDNSAYVILEHFAADNEEIVLSNYGMLLWGNHNYDYTEASMGYTSNFSRISYKNRGWTNPYLIGYMESHDEERMMYKNLTYGNSLGNYNIKNLDIAIERIKLAGTFFFTIPGPKLLWQFGELGYDVSIDYNGRTGEKPVKWEYLNDNHKDIYATFKSLIKLKSEYEVFNTDSFNLVVNDYMKKVNLYHPTMDVFIVGNFGLTALSTNQNFSKTGWWYEFFSCDSILVSDVSKSISLLPGEYKLYSTSKLFCPNPADGNIPLDSVTYNNVEQNFPNPFTTFTNFRYGVLNPTLVTLKIYDVIGNEIITLLNQEQTNGIYNYKWDGKDKRGNSLSSGVYFYRLNIGDYVETKKMMLIK